MAWIAAKLLCPQLWLGTRSFPLMPAGSLFAGLPGAAHVVLLAVFFISAATLIFFPDKKVALVLLAVEILSCLCDQNRWQPWEYQFLFMAAAYLFAKDESGKRLAWQLIIAGIYFFSGISKLNSGFIHNIWQNFILHRFFGADHPDAWLLRAGYMLPAAEILAGIGLLLSKLRKAAVYFFAAMHLIILIGIGPLGLGINSVVWPWNIAMPVMLFLLFYDPVRSDKKDYLKPFTILTLVCWWVMPWLQLAGCWDKYLSSVLYSGSVEQLYICTDNPAARKELGLYFEESKNIPCSPSLSAYNWAMAEMNVPPYPEKRIYRRIAKEWLKRYPGGSSQFILIRPGFVNSITSLEIKKE